MLRLQVFGKVRAFLFFGITVAISSVLQVLPDHQEEVNLPNQAHREVNDRDGEEDRVATLTDPVALAAALIGMQVDEASLT